MKVVQPPSTEAVITSLLLVQIQTVFVVACGDPRRPLAARSENDLLNELALLLGVQIVTAGKHRLEVRTRALLTCLRPDDPKQLLRQPYVQPWKKSGILAQYPLTLLLQELLKQLGFETNLQTKKGPNDKIEDSRSHPQRGLTSPANPASVLGVKQVASVKCSSMTE